MHKLQVENYQKAVKSVEIWQGGNVGLYGDEIAEMTAADPRLSKLTKEKSARYVWLCWRRKRLCQHREEVFDV